MFAKVGSCADCKPLRVRSAFTISFAHDKWPSLKTSVDGRLQLSKIESGRRAVGSCRPTNELPPLPPAARGQALKHTGEFPNFRETSERTRHALTLHQDRYFKLSFARYYAGDAVIFTGSLRYRRRTRTADCARATYWQPLTKPMTSRGKAIENGQLLEECLVDRYLLSKLSSFSATFRPQMPASSGLGVYAVLGSDPRRLSGTASGSSSLCVRAECLRFSGFPGSSGPFDPRSTRSARTARKASSTHRSDSVPA